MSQRLFHAVLLMAFQDLGNNNKSPDFRVFKIQAEAWFLGMSKDFIEVCHMAGYDPEYIRGVAERILKNGYKWRADPGEGYRYLERQAYQKRYREKEKERRAALSENDEPPHHSIIPND